ncbi:hypothetical protein GJAV_G00201790 [Gymnothorax javanicus]|nr:hypothetical protein GJAV_G00201790 [Gymnothorax javanicus]
MSVTISSCSRESSSTVIQQCHSSLVQPLCISPQRDLHDISTVKGQLVVLECRIRGTPPLEVLWFREEEQIEDSADFRILRKNLDEVFSSDEPSGQSSGQESDDFPSFLRDAAEIPPPEWPSSPEEEMTPHSGADGLIKCSRPATPSGLQSIQRIRAAGLNSVRVLYSTSAFSRRAVLRSPELQDLSKSTSEAYSLSEGSNHSSISHDTPEALSPSTPPSTEDPSPSPELPTTSASLASSQRDPGDSMSAADLPSFTPTLYPRTGFNYERPRHFIQSQPHFQAPSYESVQQSPGAYPNGSTKASPSSSTLSSPISTPASSSVGSPREALPPQHLSPPHTPMRSSVTLVPKSASTQPQLKPQPQHPSTAAFLSSVLPCQSTAQPKSASTPPSISPTRSPCSPPPPKAIDTPPSSLPLSYNSSSHSATSQNLSPSRPKPSATLQQSVAPSSFVSLPASYKGSSNSLPRPILKKSASRPVSISTDEEIQGSKDALIQDLEKKLRCKEARRRNNSQKLSYEERMARRLLGPDNAASVFDLENSQDTHYEQQPDSPDGRHTGGIWSAQHSGTDGNESSPIQEKCYAPRFLQVPQDLTVEEGRFCRIDFKVGGLPIPDVCWYLNGQAIRPNEYHKMLVCEKGMHSFIIEVVTVDHAGIYECMAKNRAGESRFSMRMDVIAQEMLSPPMFIQRLQNLRALEGDTVKLECKVVASPPPQLYWKKDKEMFQIDPNRMSMFQDTTGRLCLLINRVEKADAGWYTLSAINEAGMSSCNARLDVGTRVNNAAPAGRHVKVRPSLSSLSVLSADSSAEKTAPLFESDEL